MSARALPETLLKALPKSMLIALGGGVLAGPAAALELGELRLQSALGQPLRASVAYALGPAEQIHAYCIYLRPGGGPHNLPSAGDATINVANGVIQLTGRMPVREPILSLQLTVDCPQTPHLRREYSVFVDPEVPAAARESAAPAPASEPARVTPQPAAVSRPARAAAIPTSPATGRYQVQGGDSLSEIAASLPGRVVGLWQAVDALFAANPHAFINNDLNLLRAGSVLVIPDAIVSPRSAASIAGDAGVTAYEPGTAEPSRTPAPRHTVTEPTGIDVESSRPATAQPATVPPRPELVSTDAASSPIEAIDPSPAVDANATDIDAASGDDTSSAQQIVPVADSGGAGVSWSWLQWLGGGGIALILGLLIFGRRLKGRSEESSSDLRDDAASGPALERATERPAPVGRTATLDDRADGSRFPGGDIDVAQDPDFGSSGDVAGSIELELAELAGTAPAAAAPKNFAPRRMADTGIIVSETPPRHDDDPRMDERRVDEPSVDEPTVDELRVLEQDYEDELTATQALNAEIAEAARALSAQMGKDRDQFGDTIGDTTINNSLNEVIDKPVEEDELAGETSLLPAKDRAAADDLAAALPEYDDYTAFGKTTRLPATERLVDLDNTANEDLTAEVPEADNDASSDSGKKRA